MDVDTKYTVHIRTKAGAPTMRRFVTPWSPQSSCWAGWCFHPEPPGEGWAAGREPPASLAPELGSIPAPPLPSPHSRTWLHLSALSLCLAAQSCLTLQPHRLEPARLFCPWDFPGKNAGVGCHSLLQGIFPTQGSTLSLLHVRPILYRLSHYFWQML